MPALFKILMILGAILFGIGLLGYWGGDKIPLGRLPGDIRIVGERGGFYFPIVTCLVISLALSLIGMLFRR